MKNNYTVLFIMFFVGSIAGGLALNNIFEYAMVTGIGLGIIFLLCAGYFAGKDNKKAESK
ncbi:MULTISPECIES: hypothetical protein [Paraliobacillus]|uniref:hypothetical protein n=1 Tax=Paraliobacillus TaxID=200903 RepID=UPI000DD33AD6|nr:MULTISPECIES: hypothetical protein [Paraliobacillus]